MAIDDPRVRVGYLETTELGVLSSGEGDRTLALPIQYSPFSEVPVGSVYLIGTLFTKRNWVVFTEVNNTLILL